jgi:radical SAM-linked protein
MDAVRGDKDEGIRPIARKFGQEEVISKQLAVRSKKQDVRRDEFRIPVRLRIKYSKTGDMRVLSQLEIINTFARAFRRASVPTVFSEGYHPHPKVSFGPALPVGVESICEYMDAELKRPYDLEKFKEDVNGHLPDGLKLLSVEGILHNVPSLNSFITFYAYEVRLDSTITELYPDNIINLSGVSELWAQRVVERDGRKVKREINTRPFIEYIRLDEGGTLFLLLKSAGNECCRPSDVISALFKVKSDDTRILIKRTGLYGNSGGEIVSPDGIPWSMEQICLQK